MTPNAQHRQRPYAVRFDWGTSGAEAIAPGSDVAVVIDVLSFTTTLSVALDVGATVVPWTVRDESAAVYARQRGAVLAVRRSEAGPGEVSLSPRHPSERPPTRTAGPSVSQWFDHLGATEGRYVSLHRGITAQRAGGGRVDYRESAGDKRRVGGRGR